MRFDHPPWLALTCVLLAACGSDSTGNKVVTGCSGNGVTTLAPMQGAVLPADSAKCLAIEPGSGTYVVVPQFAAEASDTNTVAYQIGASSSATPRIVASVVAPPATSLAARLVRGGVARAFERNLRRREAALIAAGGTGLFAPHAELVRAASVPAAGSTRVFDVCASLSCNTFHPDTAVLKVVGTHILLYQSVDAVPPPGGFTDAQLASFGALFDQTLFAIDVSEFGAPTDIDGNGRVIVLMSPKVNALSPAAECRTVGFVAGFFEALDLLPTQPHSNRGEIYYALAPDPGGTVSCAHTAQQVEDLTGSTFLHELLHMINFGSKVLVHGLSDDETEFLDEGEAKIAEELGAKYYEAKFPPPSGRTNPSQLFPDSAEAFITGDLFDSYDFLNDPAHSTTTISLEGQSTIPDAGGEWLFDRWLGDHQGDAIFGRLVQSAQTGTTNIETQAGQPFPLLFGEFALAVYTDSLVGIPRDQVPAQFRYSSRNLRQLYQALFNAVSGPTAEIPRPFPIALQSIPSGSSVSGEMLVGTMDFFRLTAPASGAAERLTFSRPDGAAFDPSLHAQVSVFRCPSAEACP